MAQQLDPNYTASGGAWRRFGWTLLWGALAAAATYAAGNLPALAGSLCEQPWWPAAVPILTAALAAVSKWATEHNKGN